ARNVFTPMALIGTMRRKLFECPGTHMGSPTHQVAVYRHVAVRPRAVLALQGVREVVQKPPDGGCSFRVPGTSAGTPRVAGSTTEAANIAVRARRMRRACCPR